MGDLPAAPAAHTRPMRTIVFDVETTGLARYDRIITLGAVRIEGNEIGKAFHLVFDPRKDCHPGAAATHGWDDWTLRYQDLFADLAHLVFRWMCWADELVMHHAEFDLHYLQREFRKAEVGQLDKPAVCTMLQAREAWRGQSAKLDDCLTRIGRTRQGKRHGALEDAVLTAALYSHMRGMDCRVPTLQHWPAPINFKQPPPRPEGALPRREPKRRQQS